jgi:(2R)-3-sulfolactate dehydrogenase (NADP+)
VTRWTLDEARDIARAALARAGAGDAMAQSTADALVDAEAQGLASHGLSRIAQYATHLRNGRADGGAVASVAHARGGAVLVDAACGLAFPACALAVDEAITRAREFGVSFAGVRNSHHFGVAAYHLIPVARARMVGLAFRQFAVRDAGGGRTDADLRDESDRHRISAARCPAARHRPLVVGSRRAAR